VICLLIPVGPVIKSVWGSRNKEKEGSCSRKGERIYGVGGTFRLSFFHIDPVPKRKEVHRSQGNAHGKLSLAGAYKGESGGVQWRRKKGEDEREMWGKEPGEKKEDKRIGGGSPSSFPREKNRLCGGERNSAVKWEQGKDCQQGKKIDTIYAFGLGGQQTYIIGCDDRNTRRDGGDGLGEKEAEKKKDALLESQAWGDRRPSYKLRGRNFLDDFQKQPSCRGG